MEIDKDGTIRFKEPEVFFDMGESELKTQFKDILEMCIRDRYPIGNEVTSDETIRKALTYAIDREELVEGILEGYGAPSSTGLEKMPWLNEETIIKPEEDGKIDEAKKMLEEAGWKDTNNNGTIDKDGVEAEFDLLYTDGKYRQELGLAYVEVAKLSLIHI